MELRKPRSFITILEPGNLLDNLLMPIPGYQHFRPSLADFPFLLYRQDYLDGISMSVSEKQVTSPGFAVAYAKSSWFLCPVPGGAVH
jgi:hypothetical protein